jgi:hypothetical protein
MKATLLAQNFFLVLSILIQFDIDIGLIKVLPHVSTNPIIWKNVRRNSGGYGWDTAWKLRNPASATLQRSDRRILSVCCT